MSNLTACSFRDADEIKKSIGEQLSCAVFLERLWRVYGGRKDTLFGVGPSEILLSFIKNTSLQVEAVNIESTEDLYKLVLLT